MKYLMMLLFFLSNLAFADNYVNWGDENIAYFDENDIYFSVKHSEFDARKWRYDAESDSFVSDISVNVKLQSKYNTEWYSYQHVSMPMTGIKPRLYKAGWNGSFNQNHLIKVQYPNSVQAAAMQGAIRTAAARQGVKQTIQKGLARDAANDAAYWGWKNKLAGLAGLLGFLCTFECTADDKNIYDKQTYTWYVNYTIDGVAGIVYGTSLESVMDNFDGINRSKCAKMGYPFASKNNSSGRCYGNAQESGNFQGTPSGVNLRSYGPMAPKVVEQPIPDLDPKIDDWMKNNPSPAVNAPNDGKNIPEVEIPKARFLNPRPIISPPYTNPNTGEPEQETYSPSQPKTNPKPSPSPKPGDAKSPDGNSKEKNDPNKGVVPRPDVKPGEGTAPVPKPIAPPRPKPNPDKDPETKPNPETKPEDLCKLHPNILACVDATKIETETPDDDIEVPEVESPYSFQFDGFLSSNGVCPQPKSISLSGASMTMPYDGMCTFAEKIRMLVKIGGMLAALFIVFRK